jgi:hypothetical protein
VLAGPQFNVLELIISHPRTANLCDDGHLFTALSHRWQRIGRDWTLNDINTDKMCPTIPDIEKIISD